MKKTPTSEEISTLNQLLGFIIQELRTLRETGELDIDALHKKMFGHEFTEDCPSCRWEAGFAIQIKRDIEAREKTNESEL